MKIVLPAEGDVANPPQGGSVSSRTRRLSLATLGIFFLLSVGMLLSGTVRSALFTGAKASVQEVLSELGFNALGQGTSLQTAISELDIIDWGFTESQLPKLRIDIKFEHIQQIYKTRMEALKTGLLVQGDDAFVPGKLSIDGREIKMKLRLKGDLVDHLEGDKWSFRIHTKRGEQVFGLRRFSIQNPQTRGYQGELLYFSTLKRFGLLAPKYLFVDVTINGSRIGTMALEEHFSKELLERNGRKEGVIVRLDESYVWDATDRGTSRGFGGVFDNYSNVDVDAFQSSKIGESEVLSSQYNLASGLLQGFVSGALTASEVFDVEQLGTYLAISEFWGAFHAIRWHNQRFYLNPFTLKLEPIGYDANLQERMASQFSISNAEPIVATMLEDQSVRRAYDRTLLDLREQTLSNELIEYLQGIEKPVLDLLKTEYPLLAGFNYNELLERATFRVPLHSENDSSERKNSVDSENYPIYVHSQIHQQNNEKTLRLRNSMPYPVSVQSVHWTNNNNEILNFEPKEDLVFPIILEPTRIGVVPAEKLIGFEFDNNFNSWDLVVQSRVQGSEDVKATVAKVLPANTVSVADHGSSIDDFLAKYPYMKVVNNGRTVHIPKGRWIFNETVTVPANYGLEIEPGASLSFSQTSALVVFGATSFIGTEAEEINFSALSDDGIWQGIVVFSSSEMSNWKHVNVQNTSGVEWADWMLTGGVTFYRSDVRLSNVLFNNNKGEDALNVVHSNFEVLDSVFSQTYADGFDADFSIGVITNSLFRDIGSKGGGDGLDVSGSNVLVQSTRFAGVGDKAISVGERSTLSANNVVFTNIGVAVASKDASEVDVEGAQIDNASIAALMVYVKKPEYGPASLTAENISIEGSNEKALVQVGNYMDLNGEVIKAIDFDVDNLYETTMRPGLRE